MSKTFDILYRGRGIESWIEMLAVDDGRGYVKNRGTWDVCLRSGDPQIGRGIVREGV